MSDILASIMADEEDFRKYVEDEPGEADAPASSSVSTPQKGAPDAAPAKASTLASSSVTSNSEDVQEAKRRKQSSTKEHTDGEKDATSLRKSAETTSTSFATEKGTTNAPVTCAVTPSMLSSSSAFRSARNRSPPRASATTGSVCSSFLLLSSGFVYEV